MRLLLQEEPGPGAEEIKKAGRLTCSDSHTKVQGTEAKGPLDNARKRLESLARRRIPPRQRGNGSAA